MHKYIVLSIIYKVETGNKCSIKWRRLNKTECDPWLKYYEVIE